MSDGLRFLMDGVVNESTSLSRVCAAIADLAAMEPPHWKAHPLGFFLWECGSIGRASLRFHMWDPESFDPIAHSPYHDHVWLLNSLILAGAITNVTYDAVVSSDGTYHEGKIAQHHDTDAVSYGGPRLELRELNRRTYRAGDRYELQPAIVHNSEFDQSMISCTLVRSVSILNRGPRTFAPITAKDHAPARSLLTEQDSHARTQMAFNAIGELVRTTRDKPQ